MSLLLPTSSALAAAQRGHSLLNAPKSAASSSKSEDNDHDDCDCDNAFSSAFTCGDHGGEKRPCNLSPPPGTPGHLIEAPMSYCGRGGGLSSATSEGGLTSVCTSAGTSSLLFAAPSLLRPARSSDSIRSGHSHSLSHGSAHSDSARTADGGSTRPQSHNSARSHSHGGDEGSAVATAAAEPPGPYMMTPLGTPITAFMTPEEYRQHRQFLHHQRTQVIAYEHELLHKFILNNTTKIQSVSRGDHKAMVKIVIAEAYRNDPQRKANKGRWERIMRDAIREIDSKNSVLMSVSPDPYHGALAKLSSMLLHNNGVQYWSYRYWEEEMHRRRAVQQATLSQLRPGQLFLDAPVVPSTNKFAF